MFFGPGGSFLSEIFLGRRSGTRIDGRLSERILFLRSHLAVPQHLQRFQTDVPNLPSPFPVRDVFTDRRNVALSLFRFPCQQFSRSLVNLFAPFGKPFDQLRRDAFDFKIAARPVLNLITELHQCARQFVIIDIFHELLRREHFVILKCFPFFLDRVERGVEQDAVTVQVRV